ncbi:unnamed protein product [Diabrotica balteata]|uniref:Juvenile hormone acid methyltransferase n=1 Tax=Diabrotica balteata TaxID=107213 RepID=A0A9N9X6G1_DIABA|nr:unnamed protein product [Diabrotica balteata]
MIPELWLVGNIVTVRLTKIHLDKYKHLLQWKPSESILEFGCGDGQVSEQLLLPVLPKDYKEYVAMDNSKEMLDHFKQHVNIPRLQAVHRDISTKPLETCWRNRFDHVFGLFVMHMVQNPRLAMENIHSMLKPGGQALLTFFERMPIHKTFEALEKHPKWGKYGTFLSNYNTHPNPKLEYERDIKAAGFKNYVIHEEEPVGCTFDDEESCKKLYIAVNKVLPKIPDEEKDEYIKYYLEEAERQGYPLVFNEENGKRVPTLFVKMLVVLATKT